MPRSSVLLKTIFIILALGLMGNQGDCKIDSKLIDVAKNALNPTGSKKKIYISNLSFLDSQTRTVLIVGDAQLINETVEDGMKTLAQQDPQYVINQPGNSIKNNDANAKQLNEIFWDANLTPNQKVDRIISEMMEPNNVDGLVSGQFTERSNGEIAVRPFVVSRTTKQLVTESLTFTAQEFRCQDSGGGPKKVLCQSAKERIKDTVIRLLRQL